MANLRANKITSTEVFETTGSVQFDGTGDVLTVPNSADFRLGNGDFTIECWFYYKGALSSNRTLFGLFENSSARRSYQVEVRSNGVIRFEWWPDGSTGNSIDTAASTVSISTWHHYAATRTNGIITQYLNGESVASSSVGTSSFYDNTVDPFRIGALNAAVDQSFSGHISNVRVIKGKALYTKNFTPPTRELTVIPNTVLLACQSTTNAAQEATGKTITVNGNAVANELTPGLLTDVVKSGGTSAITGSVEFSGAPAATVGTDYLNVSSTDFAFGTSDFSVEMWFNSGDVSAEGQRGLIQLSDTVGGLKTDYTSGFVIATGVNNAGSASVNDIHSQILGDNLGSNDDPLRNDTWHHVALTRQSGTARLFLNGVLLGSSSAAESISAEHLVIGGWFSTSYLHKGFISNLRIVRGTALYTDNFIPPTRELKNIPGTVLLCCQDPNNPLTEVTGKTITANGDPTGSNFTPQVGSDGSVEFAGPTKINSENYFYLPTGNTESRGRGRGILAGGNTGSTTNKIDYISIQSSGISQDFGDLNNIVSGPGGGLSSQTRGLIGGGIGPGATNINNIDYITIAVTSNAIDFGDLIQSSRYSYGGSNNTRGLFGGGITTPLTNVIQYVTIASIGNAIDFGDLSTAKGETGSCSSSTRCLWGGGNPGINVIEYATIASTGNAQDFGDLTQARLSMTACSNPTRGIFGGGYVSAPTYSNVIDYVTIASTGNTQDFGDLSAPRFGLTSVSNSTRGVFCGGQQPSFVNTMEYVNISSTGNVLDFGDLYLVTATPVGCTASHGGLG